VFGGTRTSSAADRGAIAVNGIRQISRLRETKVHFAIPRNYFIAIKVSKPVIAKYFFRINPMNCPRCGHEGDHSAFRDTCPVCGSVITKRDASFTSTIYDDAIPWEAENGTGSPLKALFLTFIRSFSSRSRFFAATARTTPLAAPLLYALLMGSIGTLATFFWEGATSFSLRTIFPDSNAFSGMTESFSPVTLIITPLALLIQVCILTFYCHGMLIITRSSGRSLAATCKTICYIHGAALFQIVPFIGIFLSFLSGSFLLLEGIHALHGISRTRVFLILLLPLIIILALGAAGLALFFSIISLDVFSLLWR
jgi:ribosomal protein S27E